MGSSSFHCAAPANSDLDAPNLGSEILSETSQSDEMSVDNCTLAEIYLSLSSPPGNHNEESAHDDPHVAQILNGGPIPGLTTVLYQYQRRTVAGMMGKEETKGLMPDPTYIIPVIGQEDHISFIQPATKETRCNLPVQQQISGGILCEELGTGKTVMILALIMATIGRLPSPEESHMPVLTPLSLRLSPSPIHAAAREKIPQRYRKWPASPTGQRPGILSLVELALDVARVKPSAACVRKHQNTLQGKGLWTPYSRNSPFYLHYKDEDQEERRSSRHANVNKGPRTMFLSAGTLIVVPANLIDQWTNEINKHCDNSLIQYYIAKDKTPLPSAQQLAFNDIVLISHARISRVEAMRGDPRGLYSWHGICSCPLGPNAKVRVPQCTCERLDNVSPLLQIRWKRLIVDEGNNLCNANTHLFSLLKGLSVESKWIVTGTPTTNLMGLQHGTRELQYPDDEDTTEAVHGPCTQQASASEDQLPAKRVWTRQDRGDLNKLGTMISSFLEVPQFAGKQNAFAKLVIAPLMDPSGPQPGSVQVLRQVMESVMLRHKVDDVEKEIILPVLTYETILLDQDPYAVKDYNCMQAAVNMFLVADGRSETGDFLYYAKAGMGRQSMRNYTENMAQATFWHTFHSDFAYEKDVLAWGKKQLKMDFFPETITPADKQLFKDSVHSIERAVTDPVWCSLQSYSTVYSRVFGLPGPIAAAWSNSPSIIDTYTQRPCVLVDTEHLAQLRIFISEHPHADEPTLIKAGELLREQERLFTARETYAHHRGKVTESNNESDDESDEPKVKVAPTLKVLTKRLVEVQKSLAELGVPPESQNALHRPPVAPSKEWPLAGVRIGNTISAKLNYILKEVHEQSTSNKFLIFSQFPLTLAYVAEGLSSLGIRYTGTVYESAGALSRNVTTFESSETYRVFLMELRYGARGLNIVSASRVIFCEPVWQADVETQAIKRAHRIGQTRPVSVKVLAIRATVEETMINRRADLKHTPGATEELHGTTQKARERYLMTNPRYLPHTPSELNNNNVVLDFPLLPEPPERADSNGDEGNS
ncbi:hypothetical protein PHLGIDRAFT_35256, partial [Phlebiopsis gigantea 11061_1 CR5-6]